MKKVATLGVIIYEDIQSLNAGRGNIEYAQCHDCDEMEVMELVSGKVPNCTTCGGKPAISVLLVSTFYRRYNKVSHYNVSVSDLPGPLAVVFRIPKWRTSDYFDSVLWCCEPCKHSQSVHFLHDLSLQYMVMPFRTGEETPLDRLPP